MAYAAPSSLASSVEKTNGAKLSRLLIDGGTTVLRSIFDGYHPPASLSAAFGAHYLTLNNLLRRRVLHRPRWDLLFPPSGAPPDSQTFDITLLFLLLTNICGLSPPRSGWHTKPPPGDISLEANLARIKFYRNELYGHVNDTGIDTPTFSARWQEISAVLVALGLHQAEIDRLKAEHCGEEDYIDALLAWAKSEEDINSQLKDIQQIVVKVQQSQLEDRETRTEARQTQLEDSKTIQDTKLKVEQVSECVQTLKDEFKQNIEDLTRRKEKNSDGEILRKLAKIDTSNDVRHHAARYVEGTRLSIFAKVDRWLDDESSPNRVMVISGNAGMGKSVIAAVLCKKMLKARRLSGSHFCQHNKVRRKNPKVMLQSLACQLSDCLPEYKNALVDKLSRNLGEEINNMEVRDLFDLLFEEPFQGLNDPGLTYLVVIDGLDESEYQGRKELLDVIANFFKKLPLWIRFLVTTRPEVNIVDRLKCLKPLKLEPNGEENLKDIHVCFKKQLSHVLQSENQEIILQELVEKSEGVMLYAYYLVDFIKKNFSDMTPELIGSTLPTGISCVYQCYFERLESDLHKQLKVSEEHFLNFLCAMAAAREPLPLGFVSKLLLSDTWSSAGHRKVMNAIACMSTLLPTEDDCVHFFHKSITDWLIERSSYGQHKFSVNKTECHRVLAKLCTDELDDLKRKGVDSGGFSGTTKYALKHGVQHLLELEEDSRAYSLEEILINYVSDLELVYAKLCVNSTAASEDILSIQKENGMRALIEKCPRTKVLDTLLLLLRKHIRTLTELPRTMFQTLLNEGGPALSFEAKNLLETKFSETPYMEYLHKNDQEGLVQTCFQCSHKVACFDVSPNLDYMVCECLDNTIQLWSLKTGKLSWTRSLQEPKNYVYLFSALKLASSNPDCDSFYRSVVFHPTELLVLPGMLSRAYTYKGVLKPLFPSSQCTFSVCSVSSEKRAMLTDCPNNAKCIIMWSLIDGSEISRFTTSEDILSFAWSRVENLLAISDSAGCISLVGTISGFQILSQAHTSHCCGMIKFSPDCGFLFGLQSSASWYDLTCFHVKMDDHGNPSLDILAYPIPYNPWEFESRSESGFFFGDPIWYPMAAHVYHYLFGRSLGIPSNLFKRFPTFAFMLNEKALLRAYPNSDVIEMLNLEELTKDRTGFEEAFKEGVICSIEILNPCEPMQDRAGIGEATEERVTFSFSGDTTYVFNNKTLRAWDTSSWKLKGARQIHVTFRDIFLLAAVKDGILFTTPRGRGITTCQTGALELWNFELTECIRSWNLGQFHRVFPITEDRVVLASASTYRNEIMVLDTTNADIAPIINVSFQEFVTCNSKCQVVCLTSANFLQLLQCDWGFTGLEKIFP